MNRQLQSYIKQDLSAKLVLLSGPRQTGKTTMSKQLTENFDYLNYDASNDRKQLLNLNWNREANLVIFDELHKMKSWKSWVKGIYDTEPRPPNILVTGSACMDTYKKGGDSLAGRHHSYRLHPFTVAELRDQLDCNTALDTILKVGGFPEPFLKGEELFARRWRKSHLERIIRQDLLDLERVRDIKGLELLIDLLKDRVGSPVSYSSLAQTIQVSSHTIKHWLSILESLYIIFPAYSYHNKITRSILKMPKYYFYDTGALPEDEGMRLENTVACALHAHLNFIEDTQGHSTQLHYVRDREGREVDFLTAIDRIPKQLIEVKSSNSDTHKPLEYFSALIGQYYSIESIQCVYKLRKTWITPNGIKVIPASDYLVSDVL